KLQGDAQEIELEKALRERFPRDEIESVKSGVRGADVLQKVISDSGQLCGTILWESKRVRSWSDKWIDKLIDDKQAAKADVAVIVTDALPQHVRYMGGVRGVLLTTFSLAACLAETLHVNMALLGQTRLALSGQDDQKSRIFQYFTSPQFHDRMATIAEQFQQMQADLMREKAAMNRTWAKREKQIETIVSSTDLQLLTSDLQFSGALLVYFLKLLNEDEFAVSGTKQFATCQDLLTRPYCISLP